jgi:hypothetical protein
MPRITIYGDGGFDPDLPDNNVLEEYEEPDTNTPIADAHTVIDAVRDPDQETPSVEERLAAIEVLLVPPPTGEPA